MSKTQRQITKIAREVNKFTVRTLKAEGIGSTEYDFIHAVRKNPGITQAEICQLLGMDKGAAARRTANLEEKGYLVRQANPRDGRSQLLYATAKAEALKNSKASVEALYYDWLESALDEQELALFARLLERLYLKSKQESKTGFAQVTQLFLAKEAEQK